MSKTGNDRMARMDTDDFRFGWESAERGEPWPEWSINKRRTRSSLARIENQRFGWSEYHNQERQS